MAMSLRRPLLVLAAGLALASAVTRGWAAPAESATAEPLPAQVWWREGEDLHGARAGSSLSLPATAAPRAPLGSVWKLFAYAYLQSRGIPDQPYRCSANERKSDEEYCCDPGGRIARDDALAHSCGPYFDPQRLHLDEKDWRAFWATQQAPAWLQGTDAWKPGTEVPVTEVLDALAAVPPDARQAARRALLPLSTRLDNVIPALGGGPRFKTWSWHRGDRRIGGAAGWLADGTPFWFGAPGTSKTALRAHAAWIGATWRAAGMEGLRPDAVSLASQPCVDVEFFARYPLASVTRADGRPAASGALDGPLSLRFANGQSLHVDAASPLRLDSAGGAPRITGRMPLDEYVARVVDREGDGREPQAARALAVVVRTWLLQEARESGGCRVIGDESRAQRVSPNAPTGAAWSAAAFTTDLVLDARPVHHRLEPAAPDTLAWNDAVAAGRSGEPWTAILAGPFPQAPLVAGPSGAPEGCEPITDARDWLLKTQDRWRDALRREPGFEPLDTRLQVCRLQAGLPNADARALQIRVREWFSHEGRLTLLHEYLHLALRHHPHGQDDAYVEALARRLVDA